MKILISYYELNQMGLLKEYLIKFKDYKPTDFEINNFEAHMNRVLDRYRNKNIDKNSIVDFLIDDSGETSVTREFNNKMKNKYVTFEFTSNAALKLKSNIKRIIER